MPVLHTALTGSCTGLCTGLGSWARRDGHDGPVPDVVIPAPAGPLPAYLAAPAAPGSHPAVVLAHDVVGMTADLRRQADWLADNGFMALAPDLFHWSGHARCLLASMRDVLRRRGRAFDDLEAARGWVAADERCTGRVGVVGFCFGGGFAVLLAADPRYDASSVNYGLVPRDAERLLADACPIVGSFGADDRSTAASARRLQTLASQPGSLHEVTVYPGAGHAFLNDHDRDEVPLLLRLGDLVRPGESTYRPEAAAAARAAIVAFLHTHLDDPAG